MPMYDSIDEMKPYIHLDETNLPDMKNWEVGKEYKILLTVRQTSKNEHEDYQDKKDTHVSGGFEVLKVKNVTEKMPKEMSKSEFKKYQARKRSGSED